MSEVERLQADYEYWKQASEKLQGEIKSGVEAETKMAGQLTALQTKILLQQTKIRETEEHWQAWGAYYLAALLPKAEERWREAERQSFPFGERISRWEMGEPCGIASSKQLVKYKGG